MKEKRLSSSEIYKGKIIKVKVDDVELKNGYKTKREVVESENGVAILALDNEKKIILVKQFRYPVGKDLLELPAGKINRGESSFQAAKREFLEETGYEARQWVFLTCFYTSPGFCNEKMYIYLAKNLIPGRQKLDEGEILKVEKYSLEELWNMITEGKIEDAKTIIGILALAQNLKQLKT